MPVVETTAIISAAASASLAITAGASLASTSVQGLSQGNGIRNCVVEITNHLDTDVKGGEFYLDYGNNADPPQCILRARTVEAAVFRHVYHTASGTSGLLSYQIGDSKLAIVFSVPFDYNWNKNWYGLAVMEKDEEIGKALYDRLYEHAGWKSPQSDVALQYADAGKPISIITGAHEIFATMSNTAQAILKIDICLAK